ncbi:formate dehydrogenase subunit gamma [Thermithiobacillus plumbiphilus]|uniref:Formate dehydrogenase subunit gamma n=1 Tax=Thermithiobacillus plumbiphilus TaxID=1729899 RepID=A0ABU9D491_9PROT
MNKDPDLIVRYGPLERLNHWLVAILFILLALSGLALFYPAFFWLSALFGGGTSMRAVHPWLGVAYFIFFAWLALRFWHHNLLKSHDWQWLRQIRDVVGNREDRLPPQGRYNAGQKMLYWTLVIFTLLLLISGLIMWYQYFATLFPPVVRRFASMTHAFAGFVIILGIIIHIYSAIWVKGSIRAMVRGTVTPAWSRRFHPLWYREIKGKGE